jgi:WhiB family transcriptional regulator, redox-sensing transcriptional regulator
MTLADELYTESLMADEDVDTLEDLVNRPRWMAAAACKGQTDLFYIDRGGDTRAAKAICNDCPVWAQCLAHAIEHGERFGIWGGTSTIDRKHLRRRAA